MLSSERPSALHVLETGPLVTVQDRGRVGFAHLGVPRAGALDAPAAALANRLVGNRFDSAILEVLLGGLRVVNDGPARWAAVSGASATVRVAGAAAPTDRAFWWPSGAELTLDVPTHGLRSYVAVGGGIDVEPVLGSRSTDTLAGVGPPRVTAGHRLPLGAPAGVPLPLDVAPVRRGTGLRFTPGPRADWVESLAPLAESVWTVLPDSDRIGLRLDGPPLRRAAAGELASEGMVLGAVQVPPDGRPVVFLADHPVTGGYPVVAVVDVHDLWQCAQARPGDAIRLRPAARRG